MRYYEEEELNNYIKNSNINFPNQTRNTMNNIFGETFNPNNFNVNNNNEGFNYYMTTDYNNNNNRIRSNMGMDINQKLNFEVINENYQNGN